MRVQQTDHDHEVYFCTACRAAYEPDEIEEYRAVIRGSDYELALCPQCGETWMTADDHIEACTGAMATTIRAKLGISVDEWEALYTPVAVGGYLAEAVADTIAGRFGLQPTDGDRLGQLLAERGILTDAEARYLAS